MSNLVATGALSPPITGSVDLLIIAGEHSGDEHAANMLRALLTKHPELNACALGGPRLAAAGAQLLRDLTANSTMGFAVLGKISYYRALITEVTRWVGTHRPRAVCFVDSSALNLRIAAQMFERGFSAKAGGPTKTLYYISPQIWASRAGRRFEMARHLDGLAAIFPFEVACYADTNLPVEFVGHPFVAADYAAPVAFDPHGPVLLLPGSRKQVVNRLFPALIGAYALAGKTQSAVALYPSEEIRAVLQFWKNRAATGEKIELRPVAGKTVAASAVLTASGTMSMHCALAGIPGALTYKTDPLTYFLGRLLVKVEYIGIANLLLKEPMYPEFIQNAAKPPALAAQLCECLDSPQRLEQTKVHAAKLRELLHAPSTSSAAEWVARQLGCK